ncbi:uncharacterized protein LOC125079791 [Lutra lutra]|uniref:uncharacterized protein LOC125079791 n=1 Tax=Lutra lutra TaxID=9657 RepID=UPI001FD23F04|nr:uncharacterized protein LOC125079791 [Lutra lutra]
MSDRGNRLNRSHSCLSNLQAADSTVLPRDRGSARSTTALGWLVLTRPSFIKMYLPAWGWESRKALSLFPAVRSPPHRLGVGSVALRWAVPTRQSDNAAEAAGGGCGGRLRDVAGTHSSSLWRRSPQEAKRGRGGGVRKTRVGLRWALAVGGSTDQAEPKSPQERVFPPRWALGNTPDSGTPGESRGRLIGASSETDPSFQGARPRCQTDDMDDGLFFQVINLDTALGPNEKLHPNHSKSLGDWWN